MWKRRVEGTRVETDAWYAVGGRPCSCMKWTLPAEGIRANNSLAFMTYCFQTLLY